MIYVLCLLLSTFQDLKDLFSSGEPGLKLHMRNYCLEAHVRCKLSGHRGSVVSIAADSSMLVSGSADHTIRLWNADTWKCTGTLVGHRSVVSALQFSFPNLYSAGHDGKIRAWNVDTRSCWASIDSAKRAAIHTINTKAGRLFVGLERRWDETMNSVKVWSMDLSTSLDELPSREMQQLVSSSKRSEKAVEDLDKRIVQLGLQSRKLTRSPVKIAELSNAMENAGESKERRLQQLSSIKEQIAQLKGDIFPADDIYCTHIEKCERTTREKADIIFVGGDTKPILAWDIEKMMCIEAMDGEHHHADYTRCFGSGDCLLCSYFNEEKCEVGKCM
jgi:WD40 repeat protein